MSTDGDNIVRGRIRRLAAVHGRGSAFKFPVAQTLETSDSYKSGERVQHKRTMKNGTVQAEFEGNASLYELWEVPVVWDGEKITHGVNYTSLIRLPA